MNVAVNLSRSVSTPVRRPAVVQLRQVGKTYPSAGGKAALAAIDLDIEEGGFVSLIGRSGSGKSTLLRLISGLLPVSSGAVSVEGREIAAPPASVRYVFQDYGQSLFPWMTSRDNVVFGVKHAPSRTAEPPHIVADRYLEMVGLGDVGDRYPWELSGGMQQRLAIARALASQPRILLMDEPFGAVDALSRSRLQDLVLRLWKELSLTIVLVTHDIEEAVYLSERVIVLEANGQGVIADVAIDIEGPRAQLATREHPAFAHYRRDLHELVLG